MAFDRRSWMSLHCAWSVRGLASCPGNASNTPVARLHDEVSETVDANERRRRPQERPLVDHEVDIRANFQGEIFERPHRRRTVNVRGGRHERQTATAREGGE